jgi:hypothetical protein
MRTSHWLVVLSLTLYPGLETPAWAQSYEVNPSSSIRVVPDTWLRQGAPIRVERNDGSRVVGTFEEVSGGSLRLRGPAYAEAPREVILPASEIRSVQLGRETGRRTWSGFAIGFLGGGLAGAALGAASSEKGDKVAGATLSGLIFGPLGSLIGSSERSTTWVPLRLPETGSTVGAGVTDKAAADSSGNAGGAR